MRTLLPRPLRGQSTRGVGVLALSSSIGNDVGETTLSTHALVERPAALVLDGARFAGRRAAGT